MFLPNIPHPTCLFYISRDVVIDDSQLFIKACECLLSVRTAGEGSQQSVQSLPLCSSKLEAFQLLHTSQGLDFRRSECLLRHKAMFELAGSLETFIFLLHIHTNLLIIGYTVPLNNSQLLHLKQMKLQNVALYQSQE